jgi:uncharacterized protein (DUF2252 family)
MLVSPFTFFRGSALIMASDLAVTPDCGLRVQCCGDAHLSNFGLFASPERRLVFDINDFDETLPGPWEWDLKRLAVSLLLAARDNGFAMRDRERIVLAAAAEYRAWMARHARMRNLDVWYARAEVDTLARDIAGRLGAKMRRRLQRRVDKTLRRDSAQALAKLATVADGRAQIVSQPPLVVPAHEFLDDEQQARLARSVDRVLGEYAATLPHDRRELLRQFHLVVGGRKVVGVGSVGTHAWIALLLGRDGHDPLVLQVKEAQQSVLEGFAGASEFANSGERVVAGQRLMQSSSDIFLGWLHVKDGVDGGDHDYYVRQLRDWKGSLEVEAMNVRALAVFGDLCTATLARAHARTGDRIGIAAYLGKSDAFDRAILEFSRAYAVQNDSDYEALAAAVESGRVTAQTGL